MKIIKIKSCPDCKKRFGIGILENMGCPTATYSHVWGTDLNKILFDCPLEDYKPCECLPFQSFEKKKTVWKDPKITKPPIGVEYWILTEDNRVLQMYLWCRDGEYFGFDNGRGSSNIKALMIAEIKPPEPPK